MAIIATAEVRVIADTSRFVPDLRRKLRSAFATLGNQMGDEIVQRIDRRITQRLNTVMTQAARRAGTSFTQAFNQAINNAGLSDSLREQLGGAAARRGARRAGEDIADNFTDGFDINIRDLNQGILEAFAGSDIDTDAFFAGQRAGIQFGDGVFESLQDRLGRQMREAFEEAEATGIPPVFRRMGNTAGEAFVEEVDNSLTASLGRLFQRLGTRSAEEAGRRGGERFGNAFTRALGTLPGALQRLLNAIVVQPLSGLAGIFAQMSSEMLSMAGQALAVVALLEALSGLLFGLPAATAVAAAGIAAIIVPLRGTSEAFAAAGGDAEDFEAALEGLTPAAQSVAREFRAIAPALTEMRLQAQAAFFSEIDGAITAVAARLTGPLTEGLESASGAFGRIVDQIGEFLAQAETAETVGAVFQTLTGIFDGLAASTQPFLEGVRNLVDEFLPRIADLEEPLSRIGEDFRAWTEEIIASGAAMDAFDRGLDTLEEIFSIARDISGIFEAMFDAAESEGIDALGSIADAIADIRAEFESIEGQELLGSVFDSLGRIAGVVGGVFSSLFTNLAELAPTIADLFEEVGPPVQDLIDGLAEGLQNLLEEGGTDALRDIAEALAGIDWADIGSRLGQLLGHVGPVIDGLGDALNVVLDIINFVIDLTEFINDLFGGTSNSGWTQNIRDFFNDLLNQDEVREWIADTDAAIADFFTDTLPQMVEDGVADALETLSGWWEDTKQGWTDFWEGLGADVSNAFTGIGEGITAGLEGIVTSITTWIDDTALQWTTFWTGLGDEALFALDAIGLDVTGSLDGVSSTFSGWETDISERWDSFWNGLRDTASNIGNTISSTVSNILSTIRNTVTGWIDGIRTRWSAFWSSLSGFVTSGLKSVRDGASSALNNVRQAFDSFADRVREIWNNLVDFLQSIASTIQGVVNRISNAISSAVAAASRLSGIDLNPFANGGIVYGPTPALVGEAGPEVIIPLTRPQRAVDLVQQSGLLGLLASQGLLGTPQESSSAAMPSVEMHVHSLNSDPEQVARRAVRMIERRLGGRGLERIR